MRRLLQKAKNGWRKLTGPIRRRLEAYEERIRYEEEPLEREVYSQRHGKEIMISNAAVNEEAVDLIIDFLKSTRRREGLTLEMTPEAIGARIRFRKWLLSTTIKPIVKHRDSGEFKYFFVDAKGQMGFSNHSMRTIGYDNLLCIDLAKREN